MNKKMIMPIVFAFAITAGANSAFSKPDVAPPAPPECIQACSKKPLKNPDLERHHAKLEKHRAEFEKLSPQEREQKIKEMQQKRIQQFDNKLNLTDEQKTKAKEIRLKGHEEIKPIMDKIMEKRKEIEAVKRSKIAVEEQEKRIEAIRAEIKPLKEDADKLRRENMAEFEKILTPEQKATLNEMKKEHDERRGPKPPCDKKPPKAPSRY